MENSTSLEALYQDGTGMVSLPKKSFKASIEGYDGFDDTLSMEMARSENSLEFLDTYQQIEAKNAHDKIVMCKKLAMNYGTRSCVPGFAGASIESLCRSQSLEAAETAESAGVNTETKAAENPETGKKKTNFFKTVFKAIGSFFRKIWDFFKKLVSKITSLFAKKDKTPAVKEEEPSATVDMNIGNGESDADKAKNSTSSDNSSPDASYINADIYYLNPTTLNTAGLKKFSQGYKSLATALNSNISILKNYGNNSDANKAAQDLISGKTLQTTEVAAKGIFNLLEPAFDFKGINGVTKPSNPGNIAAMKKLIEKVSKKLVWANASKEEKKNGGVGAYKLIEILFGLKYDKQLGDVLRNKNAKNILQKYTTGVQQGKVDFANTIKPQVDDLEGPHNTLVQICDELSAKFDAYASKVEADKGNKAANGNAYWDYVGSMVAYLKLCTKFEQAVVKCTAAVAEYFERFDKLLKETKNGTKRRQ